MESHASNLESPASQATDHEHGLETEALLTFRIGSAVFGVTAELVLEITDQLEASAIPLAPSHIVGLMPLRGEAIPLVDTSRFLGLTPEAQDPELERPPRVLVVAAEGMVVGLCCDRVLGVRQIPLDQLETPRIHTSPSLAPYVTAEVHRESDVLARLNLGALLKAARVSA